MAEFKDYYALLGISPDASLRDIKRGFRARAKQMHPDILAHDALAHEQMRELLKAYEVLSNSVLREEYDLRYGFDKRQGAGGEGFDYRKFLAERTDDDLSQSKLIFFDLLHNHEKDALRLYTTLVSRKNFDLSAHLDREDFMDCAFLLAEEMEVEENYSGAFGLLSTIVKYELKKPYFRHFFEEVVERTRALLGTKMRGRVALTEHIGYVEQMIRANISRRETAFYLVLGAELFITARDIVRAEYYLSQAESLDPRFSGIQKARSRIRRFHQGSFRG